MSTSGTYNFALTTGQSVITAFRRCRVFAPSLRHDHMVAAREEMNLLFVEFANKQVNLFKVVLNSIPMVTGTVTYSIPANVVMILDAVISTSQGLTNQQDIIVTPLSRTEYMSLSTKKTPGKPTQFWFNRTPPSQTITVYPDPDANGPYTFNYYACIQMQDANLPGGETPDIPYRWEDAFISGLAHRLARIYAPELEDKRKIDAMEAWKVAATQDTENVALSIAPSIKTYYRR